MTLKPLPYSFYSLDLVQPNRCTRSKSHPPTRATAEALNTFSLTPNSVAAGTQCGALCTEALPHITLVCCASQKAVIGVDSSRPSIVRTSGFIPQCGMSCRPTAPVWDKVGVQYVLNEKNIPVLGTKTRGVRNWHTLSKWSQAAAPILMVPGSSQGRTWVGKLMSLVPS